MAITLRQTATDTSGKSTELSYQEMNNNLKSFYYSSSLSGNTLNLHFLSGSTSHSIDLSSYLDNTNIYGNDGTLTGARTVTANENSLTFDMTTAYFTINTDPGQRVIISGLNTGDNAQVLGIDSNGIIKAMNTSSIAGGGTPGGSDTQVQYNNGGSFGGSAIYFDDVNNSVGINVTPYSNRVFAVSSSAGIAMRLQSEQATANRIQFFNSSSVGAGVVAGTVNGDDFHIQQSDPDLVANLYISSSGQVYLPRIGTVSTPNIVGYDTSTGRLTYYSTGSFGSGATSPGGSDTQVQFNDGGAFGGDSGLLYDKTNNKLTVVSAGTGATTNPTIQLGTSDVSIAPGDTVGRISFSNTDSTYGGGTSYAAIYAVAPSNWGGGIYPKDVRIAAVASAATVDVATFKGSGVVQLHDYGSGNNTGTAAKWLAVDSSGNMIEENAPSSGADVSRPGSATTHTFNTDVSNNSNWSWTTEQGSGAPSGNGKMRIGDTSGTGKDASTVTAIYFDNDSTTGDRSSTLKYLQEGGTIAFRNTGGTLVVDNFTVKAIDTSNANYTIVYVSGGPSVTITNNTTYRVDFATDVRIVLADQTYNRLALVNEAASSANVVFVPHPNAVFGDYIIVEAIAASGNIGANILYHMHYSTGATTTLNDVSKAVWWMNGTDTVSTISLDYSGYGQIAIAHFRVVDYGNPSLALIGADRVLG